MLFRSVRRTFKITAETEISGAKIKGLADVESGTGVFVSYTGDEPNFVATNIRVLWMPVQSAKRPLDLLLLPGEKPVNGQFAGWTDTAVRWKSPSGGEPSNLPRPSHGMVRFASPPAAQMPRWTVCLTTGDVLVGDALTLDAGRLTLASAALGKVQFPMTLVAAIQQGQQRSPESSGRAT